MTVIGEAYIEVKPQSANFGPEAERGVLGSVGSIAKKAAAVLGGAFAVKEAFDFGRQIFAQAEEANKALAQTENVIKSTGGAANVTADEITALTDTLSKHNAVEDDAIRAGANMLLTFTEVKNRVGEGNDVFNQATSILTDMSVAMGTDMKSQAIQLGKALNDPIKGVSALSEVGVAFTEQQKEQIAAMVEAGDVAGAQRVILAELNKEFGGSAAAQATAADRARLAWGEFQEQLGQRLMPVVEKVAGFLSDNLPRALDVAGAVLDKVGSAISGLFALFVKGDFNGALVSAFGWEEDAPIIDTLFRIREVLVTLVTFVMERVVPVMRDILGGAFRVLGEVAPIALGAIGGIITVLSNPIFQVVAGVIALALTPALVALGVAATITAAQTVAAWVTMQASNIAGTASTIVALVRAGLQWIAMGVSALAGAAQVAAAWLISIGPIALVVAAVVGAAVLIVKNWEWIKDTVSAVVGAVAGFLSNLIGAVANFAQEWGVLLLGPIGFMWKFRDEIAGVIQAVIGFFGRLASGAADKIGELIGWVRGVPGRITGALGDLGSILYNAGLAIMRGLRDGIVAGFKAVAGFVGGIAGKIADLKGPLDYDKRLLIPAGVAIMDSLDRGLESREMALRRRLAAITAMIKAVRPDDQFEVRTGGTVASGPNAVPSALLLELRQLSAAVAALASASGASGNWTLNGTDPLAVGAAVERQMNWGAGG